MNRTAEAMSKASLLVLRYMTQIIECVFQDERHWLGSGSPYLGADLKNLLLWRYVHDKIRSADDGQQYGPTLLSDWLDGLPRNDARRDGCRKQREQSGPRACPLHRVHCIRRKAETNDGFSAKSDKTGTGHRTNGPRSLNTALLPAKEPGRQMPAKTVSIAWRRQS